MVACPVGSDFLTCMDTLLGSCPTEPMQCIENIISNGFMMIFGNAIYLGLFSLVILIALGIALRLEGDAFILYFSISTFIVSSAFISLTWVASIFMIGAGVIFFLSLLRIIRNR